MAATEATRRTRPRPWPKAGGVSVLSFEPVAFLRRLAPLIPPPYANLVRHYGLFAPNAKGRDLLPAAPVSPSGARLETELRAERPAPPQPPPPPAIVSTTSGPSATTCLGPGTKQAASAPRALESQHGAGRPPRRALPWAELLRRVFAIDVLVCPKCLGPMTVIAFLTDPAVVSKILVHLGLPASPPPLAPARRLGQMELFDEPPIDCGPAPCRPRRGGRAPPQGQTDRSAHDDSDLAAGAFDWGA